MPIVPIRFRPSALPAALLFGGVALLVACRPGRLYLADTGHVARFGHQSVKDYLFRLLASASVPRAKPEDIRVEDGH